MDKEIQANNKSGRVSARETAVFCTQTALLLQSGIPLSEGIETIVDEKVSKNSPLRKIAETVKDTGSLYKAVKEVDIFPSYMEQMINVGETVGKLEEVMRSLGEYYEREDKLKSSVRSVLMYPIMMILLMSAVIAILVVAVFPIFTQVLSGMGVENESTLTSIGMNIGKISLVVTGVILAVLLVALIMSAFTKGRNALMKISAALPMVKKVYKKIAAGKFASVMSLTLSSGYNLDESLELAGQIVKGSVMEKSVENCIHMTKEGASFSEAVSANNIFGDLNSRLINSGEKAGSLDEVMKKTADRTQEEAENSLTSLVSVIEPTLVIILSVVIGSILLSVMLPLIGIMSAIG